MTITVLPRPKQHKLVFIVSGSLEKPDPNTRHLIRSHVMRGKNRRKRAADQPRPSSWINEGNSQHSQLNPATATGLPFPLAKQIVSGFQLVQCANEMPSSALDDVFKYLTVVRQAMYPAELCLTYNLNNSIWVEYLAVDALWCHSALWMAQAYFDWLRGCEHSYCQTQYAHATLVNLQRRLNESQLATSDATICVVVTLVMMTALVGDHDAARKHAKGLYKMVELRGGVRAFGENDQIQLQICRADLSMAMLTDNKPMFFTNDISWGPYIAKVQNNCHDSLPKQFSGLDIKLCHIWADLRKFSRSANLAFQTGQKMDPALFQEILVSVQYRLLLLDVSPGSIEEPIRFGMLAFSTNIFLQMQGLALRFRKLSAQLRDAILGLQDLEDNSMVAFKLWLLFVARMAAAAEDEDSRLKFELERTLVALGLTSWNAVKDRLKEYLWIGVLNDNGARKFLEDATNSSSEVTKT